MTDSSQSDIKRDSALSYEKMVRIYRPDRVIVAVMPSDRADYEVEYVPVSQLERTTLTLAQALRLIRDTCPSSAASGIAAQALEQVGIEDPEDDHPW